MPPRQPQDHTPPKRTTTRKAAGAVFDLDSLEREGDIRPPFKFKHGGKTFILADPMELDLADIVAISDNPLGDPILLRHIMGDQFDEIMQSGSIPQWKILAVIKAWMEHYAVTEPGKSNA